MRRLLYLAFLGLVNTYSLANGKDKMKVVETIPVNMDLQALGVSTDNTLVDLVNSAEKSIAISAMYWDLIAESSVFTNEQLVKLGSSKGLKLYEAIQYACKRNIFIRILGSDGFASDSEVTELIKKYPSCINYRKYDAKAWYGGGIMHQKIIIVDQKAFYIGSANMDWLSFSNVKELGLLVESPSLTLDILRQFQTWFEFANLTPETETYYSDRFQTNLTVPAWSLNVKNFKRAHNPLMTSDLSAVYNKTNPAKIDFNGTISNVYTTNSPREVSGNDRSWHLNSILSVIESANSYLYLSVMDFIPLSIYNEKNFQWSTVADALLSAYETRGVDVKVLVSRWSHSSEQMMPLLRNLLDRARLCKNCKGSFEIKAMEIPGWQETQGKHAKYPNYSRVNHPKYIVSDRLIDVGTSNYTWSYFYNTAGSSLNTDNEKIISQISKIFKRDWYSSYSTSI